MNVQKRERKPRYPAGTGTPDPKTIFDLKVKTLQSSSRTKLWDRCYITVVIRQLKSTALAK